MKKEEEKKRKRSDGSMFGALTTRRFTGRNYVFPRNLPFYGNFGPGLFEILMDSRKPFHLVEIMTARSFLGTRLCRTFRNAANQASLQFEEEWLLEKFR